MVPNENCLLFCPHVLLLGLAFADFAFDAQRLQKPKDLTRLEIPAGCSELPLFWNKEKRDVPFFQGLRTYAQMNSHLSRLGVIAGLKLNLKSYCFRRGHGESLENSGKHFLMTMPKAYLITFRTDQ